VSRSDRDERGPQYGNAWCVRRQSSLYEPKPQGKGKENEHELETAVGRTLAEFEGLAS